MKQNLKTDRRTFVKKVGVGAAAFAIANSAHSANDTIQIGCIGVGGRFRHLARDLVLMDDVHVVGVCDVWDQQIGMAKNIFGHDVFSSKEYRDILERTDVDAVLIATPNHWHVPMTVEACKAGKDVYVEKPLTVNLAEGARAIDAQNTYRRIVQVGMQQRSMPHLIKAKEIVESGILGDIHKVHLTWNRNAPTTQRPQYGIDPSTVDWKRFLGSAADRPFDEVTFRDWRWTWEFGGGILTDLMVHYLDVAHWYCEVDHPSTAATIGDHVTTAGIWETPDTIQTLLHYPEKKLQIYFEGTFINARNAAMMEFMGTNATLYADRGRYEIHPENDRVQYSEWILGEGKRGADFYSTPNCGLLHMRNWIECIRSRQQPNAPAEAGVSAAAGAHLGNLAYRHQKIAVWDEFAQ